jgi:hypothetical protein
VARKLWGGGAQANRAATHRAEGSTTMPGSTSLRLPAYVPHGYSLWTVVDGVEAGGFGVVDSREQYAVTYTQGTMPAAKGTAVTVFKAPPGATTLAATDQRGGERVVLPKGANAIYHDGMWMLGPGPEQRVVGHRVLHWDRQSFHSVTLHAPSGIWGIRGPKNADVNKQELMKIAMSLVD